MKVKLDHVTNSSSTGYVFYGYILEKETFKNKDDDDFYDEDSFKKKMNLPENVDIHFSTDDEMVILGKCFMYAYDDSGIEQKDVDLNKLFEEAKEAVKIVKEIFGLTTEPKLIGGVDSQ